MRRRLAWCGAAAVLVAAAVLLVALAARFPTGPGIRPTGIISAGDPPLAAGDAETITVYLVQDGRLVPVVRPGLPGHPYLALSQLGVPLTSQEVRKGLATEIPGPDGVSAGKEGPQGTVVVDVVGEADGTRPARHWSRLARGQVACTAQAIPGVSRVVLTGVFNEEKSAWAVVRCRDFDDLIR
ncbi:MULTISPECIES: hypothetical protein [Actinomadura]|uniref:GerMN domain-containing protein n=1 Tax=Actinomadura citrea TaxID=46158 RepID=A0A7Y9G9Q8_9ACTN|nr:hypothetical protein [Actinomadura citrea]NYE12463.1 hypothetical protein [Actinomadura citrea]GGT52178.1 hypothetical protein GCM10010177_05180 [Actinomadura citrea]